MATIRKRGESWRVEIAKKGIRKSATFLLKQKRQNGYCLLSHRLMLGNIALCLRWRLQN